MSVERNVGFSAGPLFLERDGEILFQYTMDSSSVVGPRKATQADKDEHKGAWELFSRDSLPQTVLDDEGDVAFERPLRPVSEDHAHVEPAPRRGRPPKPKD